MWLIYRNEWFDEYIKTLKLDVFDFYRVHKRIYALVCVCAFEFLLLFHIYPPILKLFDFINIITPKKRIICRFWAAKAQNKSLLCAPCRMEAIYGV